MTDDIHDEVEQTLKRMVAREHLDQLAGVLESAGSATAYFFKGLTEDDVFDDLETPACIAGWFGSIYFNGFPMDELFKQAEESGGLSPE